MTDHGRILQDSLFGGRQRVDARRQNRLHCRRDVNFGELLDKAIFASCPFQGFGVDQRAHDLFDKERISSGTGKNEILQGEKTGIGAQQGAKQF